MEFFLKRLLSSIPFWIITCTVSLGQEYRRIAIEDQPTTVNVCIYGYDFFLEGNVLNLADDELGTGSIRFYFSHGMQYRYSYIDVETTRGLAVLLGEDTSDHHALRNIINDLVNEWKKPTRWVLDANAVGFVAWIERELFLFCFPSPNRTGEFHYLQDADSNVIDLVRRMTLYIINNYSNFPKTIP